MNKRLGKQINNILSSHQIELVFCPFILLDTFISSDVIESTRRASLSEPGEKEQQDFFNGYKLAIISTLFLYLEYVIRNPDIVGISPDPNFQDYWAYTKTPGKDKLKSALRQSHTTSALISRIQSVVSEILRSDSWDEFQGCLGHIQDFSLCLRRIFVKSYKCSEKIRGRWKVIDTEKGLTERAYDILWTYLMNFKMLKGVYSEAYRDYQSRYDIVEDDFEEFGDRELNMTRLHGRDNDFLLHRLPPNQWAKGYAHVTLNCLCKLTNPPIQEKLSGIYSQVSKIDTWVKYDRFQRIVRDLLSEIPNFFNPGTRWLFKQKRPIAAIDLRGLLLPVQRISNIEQVKAILGNRVRIVEIESPSATLNFKCLLDGAIVRAKRTKEKALVAEFKHPVRHNEYIPAGFNAWRECDGELAIGEVTEKDYFRLEGTDKYMRGIDAPPGFWECGDYEEQSKIIKRNMRAILQLFNIRVIVFPDRVEIKGTIPQQVLYQGEVPEPETALFVSSASP